MRGGKRDGAGRKPAEIDLSEVEKLSVLHVTDEEMGGFFGVSIRTIQARRKTPEFAEAIARGRARGKISLRRCQLKAAEAGNAALLIWLGKQILDQRDVMPVELSGPNGQELKISLEVVDAIVQKSKGKK